MNLRQSLVGRWHSVVAAVSPYWLIVILCALFVLPAIFIRAAHYEEGTTIALARSIFEDRLWPETARYGVRLIERPHGMSWLLGAVGLALGGLPVWVARLPTVAALIGGAMLVYALARRYVGASAALFGAVCLLVSPMLLQKTITAESDLLLSTIMFAAFVVFWFGYVRGPITAGRWLAIAVTLSVAGYMKGPQPLAYFFLGIAAFLVLRQRWRDLLSLVAVGVLVAAAVGVWYVVVYQPGDWSAWAAHGRVTALPLAEWLYRSARFLAFVAIELVPGVLLFAPLAWSVVRRGATTEADDLVVALVCYAVLCTSILMLWPGANGRYAMPATFAVAVGAALAFDRFGDKPQLLNNIAVAIAIVLVGYRLILNWVVMPVVPGLFRETAISGNKVAELAAPAGKLFVSDQAMDLNVLAYVPFTVRVIPHDAMLKLPRPFWAIVNSEEVVPLQRAFSRVTERLTGPSGGRWKLVEVEP